jgi:hypothetical protein
MLDIETFDNAKGGNVVYKALSHPLAARALTALAERAGRIALIDLDGLSPALLALAPALTVSGLYVQDSQSIGKQIGGHIARPLTQLPEAQADTVLIAAFEAGRIAARLARFAPPNVPVLTLDEARLPAHLLSTSARYLAPQNFATNFAFFRDDDALSTRLTTANYWAGYGATALRFFHILFDSQGAVLAEWEDDAPAGPGGYVVDSRAVRARFTLPPFTGQLFIQAVGVQGHDVVKYALDSFAPHANPSLSVTHDANAWPSLRFAGLPAPAPGERVTLWLQNSHAVAIPAGAVTLNPMGEDSHTPLTQPLAPFATTAIDIAALLPTLAWPAQIEVRTGRHVVRPRYEVTRQQRTRIAHVNVERADLQPDPGIKTLAPELGRGYLLPFPILPRGHFKTLVLPTPMAHEETNTPLRLDIFAPSGEKIAAHFLGVLPRAHQSLTDFDDLLPPDALPTGGHAELVYDFRAGGEANGWLHGLFRYEQRTTGHAAESSFGGHIFNTLMTYKNEPQSYTGKPPGLSTRLFLKLGFEGFASVCALIYPASAPWLAQSSTDLELHGPDGASLATRRVAIPCSGSLLFRPSDHFTPAELAAAGERGYVLIRDLTCRLFGYHGLETQDGRFSLDHMFGF